MSCFVAVHYRLYGTFFLQQNRLHNIYRGVPTTNIIEPMFSYGAKWMQTASGTWKSLESSARRPVSGLRLKTVALSES